MKSLNLYSTEACHLCETAKELIWPLLNDSHYQLNEVDIAEDEVLMAQYSLTIPVLENPDKKKKLQWPFGTDEIKQLIQE